jgi:hypothetical protein
MIFIYPGFLGSYLSGNKKATAVFAVAFYFYRQVRAI